MKKRKILTIANKISLLELLKLFSVKEVAKKTGFCETTIKIYRKKYRADSNEAIDKVVKQLIIDEDAGGLISYERQSKCLHPHLFVKCPHCKLILSEKDVLKIQEIISKYEPQIENLRCQQTI